MSKQKVIRRKSAREGPHKLDFPFTDSDVRQISLKLGEPRWMLDRRLRAWETYQATPTPSAKEEPWRRTSIRSIPSSSMRSRTADPIPVADEITQPLADDDNRALILLRPGESPLVESQGALDKEGVIFTVWSDAVRNHAGLLKEYMGTAVTDQEGKFAALAGALAENGVFVYVPKGVDVRIPLHSILWAPGINAAFFTRLLVVLEEGSSATVLHESASPTQAGGEGIHAGIVELHVGEGANLRFVELQNWGRHIWNFTHERAVAQRDSVVEWVFGAVGSKITKNFTELNLVGQGAEGRMSGFYLADGKQHFDHDTKQNHLAPATSSDLLFKGALLSQSRSVWHGMIHVAPGAQKADGYQANRNLILSKGARADSIPGLEIKADDVRCTHGATVSQLEEEPIYYLMSRGLPRDQAERLLVDGFFNPIMLRIPFEKVRKRFENMIDERMK
jgi:Fe-S cluster assembly protein SufD